MHEPIRTLTTTLALTLATLFGAAAPALAASPTEPAAIQQASETETETETAPRFDAAVTLEGQININTASAAELELLPGVGPAISGRIVDYRAKHPFKARNNIMRVKGVGKKTFHKIKDYLIVEGETTLRIAK